MERGKHLHSSSQLRAYVACTRVRARAYVQPSPGCVCVRAARALEHHLSDNQHTTTQDPAAAPRTQLINLAASKRSTQEGKVPGPRRLRSRSASSRGPKKVASQRGRPGSRAASPRLPRKKRLKLQTLLAVATEKGGLPGEKKWREGATSYARPLH